MAILAGKRAVAVVLSFILGACGGGGGGGGGAVVVNPPPPVVRTPQSIVYSAGDGLSVNGLTELYAIDDSGQNGQLLSSATTSPGAQINQFAVSPDKQWVAYLSDQFTNLNWVSLYVVPVDGSSAPVRVSRRISNNGSTTNRPVKSFQWSPDSMRLVYAANHHSTTFFADEVFIVNRDGTGESKINGSTGAPAVVEVTNPQWSPDGRFVVQEVSTYAGSVQQNTHGLNIYDTTMSGPNSRRLFTPRAPADTTAIRNVRWSPDSTRISYLADQEVAGEYNIFVIDVVSGENTRVSDNGDFNGDSRWSPDGSTLAYLDHPSASIPSDLVVSAAAAGAIDTVLAFVSPNGGIVKDYAWSPDGQRIAYTSDEGTRNQEELYVVNADGTGMATRINGALTSGGDVFEFAWSPDGSSVAYLADQTTDTFVHLYVSGSNGAGSTAVSTALNGEEALGFAWSADSQRISFTTGPEGSTPVPDKLYSARPDGTERQQITAPMDVGPVRFIYK